VFLKLLIITLFSYILIKIIINNAKKLGFVDIPNNRSHHCDIIASGAGIGFVSAITLGIGVFDFSLFIHYWYIFLALSIVFVVGIIDDRYAISARWKFVAIFVAVFVMWLNGTSIDSFGVWFGYHLTLPSIAALIFTMFALAGFTNALNLIDGIDGLASSISIVILSYFLLIGFEHHDKMIIVLSSFTIASLVGFLFLNWYPAKIFMGDSGSLSLGFIISILAVLSLKYIHPITILYLTAIPILDTLIVMIRRIRRNKSPFEPDKTHLHHILVKFFEMNVRKTVFFMVILQLIFSNIGYMLIGIINKNPNSIIPLLATIGFVLMFVLFYIIFTGIKKRQIALEK